MVNVQSEDFDVAALYQSLRVSASTGAVVNFVGLVRDYNQGCDVTGLTLEHYPGMTEKALTDIEQQARQRWPLLEVVIVHRIGDLALTDQIVFVGVASAHREAAFSACDFIMDYLKTRAPFWKKERTTRGERWVEAENKDQHAASRWVAGDNE